MKKILIIPWTISDGGGSEKILSNVLASLENENLDIEVFEIQRGNHIDYIQKYKKLKFRYLFKKKSSEDTIVTKFNRKLKMILLIYSPAIIKKKYFKEKYEYIIAFNYLYPSFLASKFEGKKIMWIHGTINNLKENFILRKMQGRAFGTAYKIVSIANTTQKTVHDMYKEYKEKSIVIKNGFKISEIIELSNGSINKKTDLVAIGRLDDNKNFEFLLEVMHELKKYDLTLNIIGEGEKKFELKNKIKELGLIENVKLLGYKKNVYEYIKNSKILLLSSKTEGFPTVIVEGLALGKPFISTDVGGVKELSNNGECGRVIYSKKEMVGNIIELISNKKLYNSMSRNSCEFVKKYDDSIQKKEILKLLE
ncbi:MAG: glycosyltransferase [Sarcina sp.]